MIRQEKRGAISNDLESTSDIAEGHQTSVYHDEGVGARDEGLALNPQPLASMIEALVNGCECTVATAHGSTWGLTVEDQLQAMHLAAQVCEEALELWKSKGGDLMARGVQPHYLSPQEIVRDIEQLLQQLKGCVNPEDFEGPGIWDYQGTQDNREGRCVSID